MQRHRLRQGAMRHHPKGEWVLWVDVADAMCDVQERLGELDEPGDSYLKSRLDSVADLIDEAFIEGRKDSS